MLINSIHTGSIRARCKFNNLSYGGYFVWRLVFICFGKNILPTIYVNWGPSHLSLIVCYLFHLLIPLPCKTWFYKDCNKNCNKNPVLDVIRTLGTSNQAKYYNLQYICFSSLIDLDTFSDNVTKYRCFIPMETTVSLCHLKYSLKATRDHHGPSSHSGNFTASVQCCKNHITFHF